MLFLPHSCIECAIEMVQYFLPALHPLANLVITWIGNGALSGVMTLSLDRVGERIAEFILKYSQAGFSVRSRPYSAMV